MPVPMDNLEKFYYAMSGRYSPRYINQNIEERNRKEKERQMAIDTTRTDLSTRVSALAAYPKIKQAIEKQSASGRGFSPGQSLAKSIIEQKTSESPEDIYSRNRLPEQAATDEETKAYLENERKKEETQRTEKSFKENITPDIFGDDEKTGKIVKALIESRKYDDAVDYLKGISKKKSEEEKTGVQFLEDVEKTKEAIRNNTTLMLVVKKYASGQISEAEKNANFRGWGEKGRSLPAAITALAIEENPDFSPREIDISRQTQKQKTVFDTLIPSKVELAGKEATAKNLAPEKLPKGTMDELNSMRKQYFNLSGAARDFKDNFVTPYIGKGIKMAVLRQTDPDFGEFQSNLALALNEYRRLNFGTAQTKSEIDNFLDVVNSNFNVTPEVFNKQLGTVINTIERNYDNDIKSYKSQKYMTAGYENIVPPASTQPKTKTIAGDITPKTPEQALENTKKRFEAGDTRVQWTPEKESRLQELQRKKREGTLK